MLILRHAVQVIEALKHGIELSFSSAAAIEIVVFFMLLLVVEHLAPGSVPFATITPHPYWAFIILISVRHGSGAGLTAAILSIASYCLHGLPPRMPEDDYYVYSLRVWREPILWLVTALIIGEIRLSQIAERDALAAMLRKAENNRSTIAEHCDVLSSHIENLERAIVTEASVSIATALDAIAALRTSSESEVVDAFQQASAALLGNQAHIAFWRVPGGNPKRLPQLIWSTCTMRRIAPTQQLMRATQSGNVLSIARKTDRAILDRAAMLAVEVRSSLTPELYGVLLVAELGIDELKRAEISLSLLAKELSTTLDRHAAMRPRVTEKTARKA